MSAYMLDKAEIDQIVETAIYGPADAATWTVFMKAELADDIGDLLIRENLSSIHYRYPDTQTSPENTPGPCNLYWLQPYTFEAQGRISRDAALGLLRSYAYQSCEHPEWEASNARAFVDLLTATLKACSTVQKPKEAPRPVIQYSITETAKIIRAELKKAFPETKFSVRSKSYSMGCHISIHYTDGPPTKAVDAIIAPFHGKTFDGMDDSTHYHNTEWNGQLCYFAGSRPSVSRSFSAADPQERMQAILRSLISYDEQTVHYLPREHSWRVLSTWDARWETLERAAIRWIEEGCRQYV